ncbi:MAG: hypothetical protein ACU88J_11495 [Gammaproteobacteria bacterium]
MRTAALLAKLMPAIHGADYRRTVCNFDYHETDALEKPYRPASSEDLKHGNTNHRS